MYIPVFIVRNYVAQLKCVVHLLFCAQTTSRAGWQSPREENAMSPKSDHFLYRHTIRSPPSSSTASPRNMPRKSSYTLDSGSASYNHHQQYPGHQQQRAAAIRNTHYSHDFAHSNSQPVSLQHSKSEDTQRIFNGESVTNGHRYSTATASSSSTSNEMLLDANLPQYERILFDEPPSSTGEYFLPAQHPSVYNNRDSGVETSNRDSFESSSTSASANYLQYKDDPVGSGNRLYNQQADACKSNGRRNQPSRHQYGKIALQNHTQEPNVGNHNRQHMPSPNLAACQPYVTPVMPQSGSGKQRNVNFQPLQVTCDNSHLSASHTQQPPHNNNNNINHVLPISAREMARTAHRPPPPTPTAASSSKQHVSFVNGNGAAQKQHHLMASASDRVGAIGLIKSTAPMHHPTSRGRLECGGGVGGGGGAGRNNTVMVRPMMRGVGGSMGPPHQIVHMINSLSSPESAYSTGYSTDGTSPGKLMII